MMTKSPRQIFYDAMGVDEEAIPDASLAEIMADLPKAKVDVTLCGGRKKEQWKEILDIVENDRFLDFDWILKKSQKARRDLFS